MHRIVIIQMHQALNKVLQINYTWKFKNTHYQYKMKKNNAVTSEKQKKLNYVIKLEQKENL